MNVRNQLLAIGLAFLLLPATAFAGANTLFWKITSPRGTVYLLGSIHTGTAGLYPLPGMIEEAFEGADYLVLEADPSAGMETMMGLIRERGMYAGGRTLQDDLPAKSYSAFAAACAKDGLDIEAVRQMRPWLAALTYSQVMLSRLGFDPQYGIDFYYLAKASGDKKVLELESVERQIALLSGLSPELQAAFLEQTVSESAQMAATVDQMQELWKSGDGGKLSELAEQSFDKNDAAGTALYHKLILERNATMADAIAGYLAAPKTYFVIIGAGHLLGDRGVVQLLKSKGFSADTPLNEQ